MLFRSEGSGTRGAFVELTGVEQKDADGKKIDMTTEEAIVQSSTQNVITAVNGDTYAIGYVSLGSLNKDVKAVKVDGVEATVDTVKSGDYKVQRPFNIATKDDVSDAAKDFISYIMSSEGQAIIEDNGYIKVNDSAAALLSCLSVVCSAFVAPGAVVALSFEPEFEHPANVPAVSAATAMNAAAFVNKFFFIINFSFKT